VVIVVVVVASSKQAGNRGVWFVCGRKERQDYGRDRDSSLRVEKPM
jgi:hypothetical protein